MMHRKFKWQLFIVLLIFTITVGFTISTIDYIRVKNQINEQDEFEKNRVEETAIRSLKTIDKAYSLLDQETAQKMQDVTFLIQEKYEENPDFKSWDFEKLAKSFGMDIYIINQDSTITFSNVKEDIGLNFSECCVTLDKILKKRRATGQLYIDGIDIEQHSGEVKKYSYMATTDKKYMIELGYALKNEAVFKELNFLTITDEMEKEFDSIAKMNVFNIGGIPFGEELKKDETASERKKAAREARDTHEMVEMDGEFEGFPVVYRYIPYMSEHDSNTTQVKILEVIYNEDEMISVLKEKRNFFILQLLIIVFIATIAAILISRWFAKPVHTAFYDSLTDLKNRAALADDMPTILKNNKNNTALLIIDLVNFKYVNSYLCPDKGNALLQMATEKLNEIMDELAILYLVGNKQFAVVVPDAKKEELVRMAESMIHAINDGKKQHDLDQASVSVSIGIAFSDKQEQWNSLFDKADIALHQAKETGKDNYLFYDSSHFTDDSPSI